MEHDTSRQDDAKRPQPLRASVMRSQPRQDRADSLQQSQPDATQPQPREADTIRVTPRHAKTGRLTRTWPLPVKIAVSLAILLVLAVGWVGSRALLVRSELVQAQALIPVAKTQVSDGDYADIPATFEQIHAHTSKARGATEGPLWWMTEKFPLLGPNLKALRGLTEVVDDTMVASAPLVALAPEFTPAGLSPRDGRIPLAPFDHIATALPPFAEQFPELRARLAAVPTDGAVAQLQDAKVTLTDAFDSVADPLDQAAPVVAALPGLLGADGPRTYVVMFQNNAELRSLGGTALSFVEVNVDGGAISLAQEVPAGFGQFPIRDVPVIPAPEGFNDVYRKAFGLFIANATLRPSSITAAQIVQAEWKAKYGTDIDGVISMDGPALSALLAAVGPVTLSTGDVVDSTNVTDLLFNGVYQRYNSGNPATDNLQQNVVYSETVNKTFALLASGAFDPKVLLSLMSEAATANDFKVWLADSAEQGALSPTSFGAQGLPESSATTDVVGIYLNDQVGSKLNYYLSSTADLSSAMCGPNGRQVHRVSLALTSTLDPAAVVELSPSISGATYVKLGLDKGVQRLVAFVYLPKDATLLAASIDGEPVAATGQNDEGHPVQVLWINIPPGGTGTLSVDVLMGTPGERVLEADITPTLTGTPRTTSSLDCGTVTLLP